MKNSLKPIEISYNKTKIIFYLQQISVAQDDEITEAFNELADSELDKYQKEFEICRNVIADYSVSIPSLVVKEKGETITKPINESAFPSDAVNEYFKERTVENERIIRTVFASFRALQQPNVRFL